MKKLMIFLLLILLTGCHKEDISVVLNPGYDIVGLNTDWEDAGCDLHVDSDIYEMTASTDNFDKTNLGEYVVNYELEYDGEEYTCIRIVKFIDVTAPTVVLIEGIDTVKQGATWDDAGVSATDNIDTELTTARTGTVDTTTIGRYEITYITTDSSSNTTVIKRIVNVIE